MSSLLGRKAYGNIHGNTSFNLKTNNVIKHNTLFSICSSNKILDFSTEITSTDKMHLIRDFSFNFQMICLQLTSLTHAYGTMLLSVTTIFSKFEPNLTVFFILPDNMHVNVSAKQFRPKTANLFLNRCSTTRSAISYNINIFEQIDCVSVWRPRGLCSRAVVVLTTTISE